MVNEIYKRTYVYNTDSCCYNFFISNNGYENGSYDGPAYKVDMVFGDTNDILEHTRVEFGDVNPLSIEYQYIMSGFSRILEGRKSDWKIVALYPTPGSLTLTLRNRKLCRAESLLNSIDCNGGAIAAIQFRGSSWIGEKLTSYVIIEIQPPKDKAIRLRFSSKQKHIKYAKHAFAYHDITIRRDYAKIEEIY